MTARPTTRIQRIAARNRATRDATHTTNHIQEAEHNGAHPLGAATARVGAYNKGVNRRDRAITRRLDRR